MSVNFDSRVEVIRSSYEKDIARSTYFAALAASGLVPCQVVDLTAEAIPYWELRQHSEFRNGIEQAFLSAYQERCMSFLLIAAERRASHD